jgi:hypothetical protein
MNLSRLHRSVRAAVLQGRVDDRDAANALSASERRALRAFDKRLKAVGGHAVQLTPPVAGSLEWLKQPAHAAE